MSTLRLRIKRLEESIGTDLPDKVTITIKLEGVMTEPDLPSGLLKRFLARGPHEVYVSLID